MPPTVPTLSLDRLGLVGPALINPVTGSSPLCMPSLELLLPLPSVLSPLPQISPLPPRLLLLIPLVPLLGRPLTLPVLL